MRALVLLFAVCVTAAALAQAPQAFSYQAVARNAMGDPLAGQNVGVQFQLHQATPSGAVVYSEVHATSTNAQGLFNLQVGTGAVQTGVFAAIDWSAGPYFMEVGLDATGGSAYISMGNQQLLSVPYALFAQRTNCFTTSLLGDTLYQGNGCFVIIPGVSAANGGCLDLDADGFYDRPGCGPVDCLDSDPTINPGGTELCGDGLDNDCNGQVDDLTDPQAFTLWFADADADGYGDLASTVMACAQPTGYVANNDDCDDADPLVFPGNNCSIACTGTESAWIAANQQVYFDALFQATSFCFFNFGSVDPGCIADQLSQSSIPIGADCNTCGVEFVDCLFSQCLGSCLNGFDANCLQCVVDNGCMATFQQCVGFTDQDGDGYADASDCMPSNASAYPGATEICGDGIDNNCNNLVDESAPTWYQDLDGDGWGDAGVSQAACTAPAGYVQESGDCDDSDPDVNPGVEELCNGIDDNCNGAVDDNPIDGVAYYQDQDGDGYGDEFSGFLFSCTPMQGFAANNTDCNDFDPNINPGMIEVCDLFGDVDNNCDGNTQPCVVLECGTYAGEFWGTCGSGFQCVNNLCEPCPAAGTPCDDGNACTTNDLADGLCNCVGTPVANGTACSDADPCTTTETCVSGVCQGVNIGQDDDADSFTDCGGDCDDQNAAVFPGAPELCDGLDNDCDGQVDEDCALGQPCDGPDADQCTSGIFVCDGVGGCTCNETGPGNAEVLDGADNDCDGSVDEGLGLFDQDNDGFVDDIDCNDQDPNTFPGASELCDGMDNDCNGQIDEGGVCSTLDQDGDGFPAFQDCDDFNPSVNPNAMELCDGMDNDCNGTIDDGLGTITCGVGACQVTINLCMNGVVQNCVPAAPSLEVCDGLDNDCDGQVDEGGVCCTDADQDGFFAQAGCGTAMDCNDNNPNIKPGATEFCNGIDDDCDAQVDEGVGCSVPNGVGSCNAGQCTIAFCNSGFANCDGNAANGCETNLNTSVNNCGQCGQPCMLSNAIPACVNGLCTIAACLPGFSDCDGFVGNGCETFGTCP